jgi:hypothetical protein
MSLVYLQWALIVAGVLHFGLLAAGLSTPRVLDWRNELRKVNSLTRQLVLVHGAFIILTIIAFGLITLVAGPALVAGDTTALLLTGFIGRFWLIRFYIQVFYFDARPWLTTRWRKLGYTALYGVFAYLSTVYLLAAWTNWIL